MDELERIEKAKKAYNNGLVYQDSVTQEEINIDMQALSIKTLAITDKKKQLKRTNTIRVSCINCGLPIEAPKRFQNEGKFIRCKKCNEYMHWNNNQWNKGKPAKLDNAFTCTCGNTFPVGTNATETKCFSCNTTWLKDNNTWLPIPKDQVTIGDLIGRT